MKLCYGGSLELKLSVIKFATYKVHGCTAIKQYFANVELT